MNQNPQTGESGQKQSAEKMTCGVWEGMVDYSHYTGDKSYDKVIAQAIYEQSNATTLDFMMVATQYTGLGNDDMLVWAMGAMAAAEYNFTVPAGQTPDLWLRIAESTFNSMVLQPTAACRSGIDAHSMQ